MDICAVWFEVKSRLDDHRAKRVEPLPRFTGRSPRGPVSKVRGADCHRRPAGRGQRDRSAHRRGLQYDRDCYYCNNYLDIMSYKIAFGLSRSSRLQL